MNRMKTKNNNCKLHITIVLFVICILTNSIIFGQKFTSVNDIAPLTISSNTGEKPQSKVWNYDNNWWAVLADAEGTYIWKLKSNNDEYKWIKTLKISDSSNTYADCKLNLNRIHILLFDKSTTPASSILISVEYDNKLESYKTWSKNSDPLLLNFENNSVETATIEKDGQNKIWLAYEKDNKINVRWSDSPYSKWSEEITLCEGVKDDDICSIITLNNKIGVLWSNQNTKRFGFRLHADNDAPGVWSDDEIPANKYALDIGEGIADDHLNLAVSKDGTLYCAVKTSYDKTGYTKIGLLIRDPKGNWSKLYKVSENGTRPIVILNELTQNIKVLYTSTESGGNIIYKESNINEILFCDTYVLIEKKNQFKFNNVSSTKNNYTSEIVIIASSGNQLASVIAE
jgi:hypothetical protein